MSGVPSERPSPGAPRQPARARGALPAGLAALDPAILDVGEAVPARVLSDWHVQAEPGVRPLALARPRSTDEVAQVLRACEAAGVPVVPQGGLTGLVGGAVPVDGCVALSLERLRAIESIDAIGGTITVQAGVPLQAVQEAADAADMLFPLDIGARGSCLIGGNVSTNAGGNRVLRYGMARDLVLGLEAVLADGTVISAMNTMLKNNTGYDLKQLFIGSEGTLGVVTRLVLRLFPKPRTVNTALCACADFASVYELLKRARARLAGSLAAFELMWPAFYARALDAGGLSPPLGREHAAYVLIESMGTDPARDADAFGEFIERALLDGVVADGALAMSAADAQRFWAIRDMSGTLVRALAPVGNYDVSIETGRIDAFEQALSARLRARWPGAETICFGHLADSNLHLFVTVPQRPFPEHEVDTVVYDCVGEWGGSISAEHGIGVLKRPFLDRSRSPQEIAAMRRIKAALDPRGILNPGKVI
jgi:FAD/FMN-containing dehydrogenase